MDISQKINFKTNMGTQYFVVFEIKLYELNKIRDVKKNKTMLCIRIGTDIYALE